MRVDLDEFTRQEEEAKKAVEKALQAARAEEEARREKYPQLLHSCARCKTALLIGAGKRTGWCAWCHRSVSRP